MAETPHVPPAPVGARLRIPALPQAHISHQIPTAATDPGMSSALRSVGILTSLPVCAASLRNLLRKTG